MIAILQVFLVFCFLSEGLFSAVNTQVEDETFESRKTFICSEDGVFCSNGNEFVCKDGKLMTTKSCSHGNDCVNDVGCTSLDLLPKLLHAAHNGLPDILPPCEIGTLSCFSTAIIFCSGGFWQIVVDCADLRQTCENGQCVALPPTTIVETTTPLTTRKPICTEGNTTCVSKYAVVYCRDGDWELLVDCSVTERICRDGACVIPLCITGDKRCNGSTAEYCMNESWIPLYDCSSNGSKCVHGVCVK